MSREIGTVDVWGMAEQYKQKKRMLRRETGLTPSLDDASHMAYYNGFLDAIKYFKLEGLIHVKPEE